MEMVWLFLIWLNLYNQNLHFINNIDNQNLNKIHLEVEVDHLLLMNQSLSKESNLDRVCLEDKRGKNRKLTNS